MTGFTIRTIILVLVLAAELPAGEKLRFEQSEFTVEASGWTAWSDRSETMPRTWVENLVSLGQPGSLAVSGNGNLGSFGGWQRVLQGIEAGTWYRLTVHYRSTGFTSENWQIQPRLDWRKTNGERAGEVDYAYRSTREGEWTNVTLQTQAPKDSDAVAIQLFLAHAPQGTVWWDDIRFERVAAPAPRLVTIASVNLRPKGTGSSEKSVEQFIETAERVVPAKVDLVVLPEGITVVGTEKRYAEVAEPVPGPTTKRLGEFARRHKTYLVAGLYEREGQAVYNTAVLLDREGQVAGKYRKVYLPREEMQQLTPGNDYPVFQTDFGALGIMICYDVFYADAARGLTAGGAEIVAMPIWGGDETLAKARAIENQIYLVASGYDHPTYIMNPSGEWLAVARERGSAAIATIDLNKCLRQPDNNLGDMRNRLPKELRLDVATGIPGRAK
ncbi:MAG TPA: carbon-nitrogen hydrolase family protein [Bryobacteraceae bacterium]|jgi:predicted amidohydrolase